MGLQTAYVPAKLAPGIERLSFTDASLYEILAARFGLYPASARETHKAIAVPEDAAPLLRVSVGSPALAAERLTSLGDGRPLWSFCAANIRSFPGLFEDFRSRIGDAFPYRRHC